MIAIFKFTTLQLCHDVVIDPEPIKLMTASYNKPWTNFIGVIIAVNTQILYESLMWSIQTVFDTPKPTLMFAIYSSIFKCFSFKTPYSLQLFNICTQCSDST